MGPMDEMVRRQMMARMLQGGNGAAAGGFMRDGNTGPPDPGSMMTPPPGPAYTDPGFMVDAPGSQQGVYNGGPQGMTNGAQDPMQDYIDRWQQLYGGQYNQYRR